MCPASYCTSGHVVLRDAAQSQMESPVRTAGVPAGSDDLDVVQCISQGRIDPPDGTAGLVPLASLPALTIAITPTAPLKAGPLRQMEPPVWYRWRPCRLLRPRFRQVQCSRPDRSVSWSLRFRSGGLQPGILRPHDSARATHTDGATLPTKPQIVNFRGRP